jgi:hypothetical protein
MITQPKDSPLENLICLQTVLKFKDSSPHCGPCNALVPKLEKFHRVALITTDASTREVGRVTPCAPQGEGLYQNGAQRTARPSVGITVVMISRGEPKENRAKTGLHALQSVLTQ